MPRSGVGVYTLPALNPVVPATTITSAWGNNTMNDIATALTQSIASTGVTTPTANLPMGGFKHTGVALATAFDHYARADQVQESSFTLLTGVANSLVSGSTAYTANLSLGQPGSRVFASNQMVIFIPNGDAVGIAPTLSVNGDTARTILATGGSPAIFLKSGTPVALTWNGASWVIANSGATYGSEWIPETNAVTWVNATQVKFVGVNLTARYPTGIKVKLLDNGNQRYGWVLTSAFGADTTLTLTIDDSTPMVGPTTVFQYSISNPNHLSAPVLSAASATNTSSQNVTVNTNTLVTLDSEQFDTLGEFAASRFTALYAGRYLVNAALTEKNSSAGRTVNIVIFKTGSTTTRPAPVLIPAAAGYTTLSLSMVISLAVGDYLELFIKYAAADANNFINAGSASMSVIRVD